MGRWQATFRGSPWARLGSRMRSCATCSGPTPNNTTPRSGRWKNPNSSPLVITFRQHCANGEQSLTGTLVDLGAGRFHDARPLRAVCLDRHRELLGCLDARRIAAFDESLADRRLLERAAYGSIDFCDHLRVDSLRPEEPEPGVAFKAR